MTSHRISVCRQRTRWLVVPVLLLSLAQGTPLVASDSKDSSAVPAATRVRNAGVNFVLWKQPRPRVWNSASESRTDQRNMTREDLGKIAWDWLLSVVSPANQVIWTAYISKDVKFPRRSWFAKPVFDLSGEQLHVLIIWDTGPSYEIEFYEVQERTLGSFPLDLAEDWRQWPAAVQPNWKANVAHPRSEWYLGFCKVSGFQVVFEKHQLLLFMEHEEAKKKDDRPSSECNGEYIRCDIESGACNKVRLDPTGKWTKPSQ